MLLQKDKYLVEKSNNSGETVDFGIKNPAIIFDILCNKLYENPLKILVQEYMCNARDSHREVGSDKPITVILPTNLDPTLKIIDVGVGISPDRMNNVFVYLGESTKNGSNKQTGGFGVGAKVGWAYTDSFTIKTIYDNVQYTYLAYKGNKGVGQLDLLFKEEGCNLPNGTTIEITINASDFYKVYRYVHQTSHFWKTRPIIKNAELLEVDYNKTITDQTFGEITVLDGSAMDYYERNNDYLSLNHRVHAVVDGIIYFDIGSKVPGLLDNFNISKTSSMFIKFNVGEIDLAVNRENLQYTKNTINTIRKKIDTGYAALVTDIDDFIDKQEDIVGIIENLSDLNNCFRFIKKRDFVYDHMKFTIERTGSTNINKLQLKYDFMDDAIVQYYTLDHNGMLRYEKDSTKTFILLSSDSFDKGNIIFNDKYTKTFDRPKVKAFMYAQGITKLTFIQPIKPREWFENVHSSFFTAFEKCIKLTDAAPKSVRDKINGMICYTYDSLSYKGCRVSTQFENLGNDFTFLFIPYVDADIIECTNKQELLNLYNAVYGTKYKLIVVSKANERKIKKLGLWKHYQDWYSDIEAKVFNNVQQKWFLREHAAKLNPRSAFDPVLKSKDILDPKVKQYFDTLKYVKQQSQRYKNYTNNVNKLNLFKSVANIRGENYQEHPAYNIIRKLIQRKLKKLTILKKYIINEYRLVVYGVNYNVSNSDVVEFMNLKFNNKKGVLK